MDKSGNEALKEFSNLIDEKLAKEAFHKCVCGKYLLEGQAAFVGKQEGFGDLFWYVCPHCCSSFLKKEEAA